VRPLGTPRLLTAISVSLLLSDCGALLDSAEGDDRAERDDRPLEDDSADGDSATPGSVGETESNAEGNSGTPPAADSPSVETVEVEPPACDAAELEAAAETRGVTMGGVTTVNATRVSTGFTCSPGLILAELPCASGLVRWLRDVDGDGYVSAAHAAYCEVPGVTVANYIPAEEQSHPDCDDDDPELHQWVFSEDLWEVAVPKRDRCVAEAVPAGYELPDPPGSYLRHYCAVGWRHWGVDEDGDDHVRIRTDLCALQGAEVEGYALYSLEAGYDCDDADANASADRVLDEDGDQFRDEPEVRCVGATDEGYASPFDARDLDCDPDDFELNLTVYHDSDGDGAASRDDTLCVNEDELPDGYLDLRTGVDFDCDDEDPSRHPAAPESWFDDTDQNCDGADNPVCAFADPELAPGPSAPESAASLDPDCSDRSELAIAALFNCPESCDSEPNVVVQLSNLGGEAYRGMLTVRWTSETGDSASVDLDIELEARTIGPIYPLPLVDFGLHEVVFEPQGGDCKTDNNGGEYLVNPAVCFVP
jgi:hypothetical protein